LAVLLFGGYQNTPPYIYNYLIFDLLNCSTPNLLYLYISIYQFDLTLKFCILSRNCSTDIDSPFSVLIVTASNISGA